MNDSNLKSVSNALSVIEILDREAGEVSLTQISKELGIAKSTAYRLLSTLENRNYVFQNPETGKYKLDMKITHIGFNIMQKFSFTRIIRPYIEALSSLLNLSIYVSVYNHGYITYIDEVIVSNAPILDTITGFNFPASVTSSGKLFLSELNEDSLNREMKEVPLQSYTPYSITDMEIFIKELEKIRNQGYSTDEQECKEGIITISVPIKRRDGKFLATICASAAVSVMEKKRDNVINELLNTSVKLSRLCSDY